MLDRAPLASGERGIGLLTLLGKIPFVDAADARTCPFAESNQPGFQIPVFERSKLVEDGKQDHRRQLREQHKQHQERRPGNEPPMLRLTNDEIEQLYENCSQHEPY